MVWLPEFYDLYSIQSTEFVQKTNALDSKAALFYYKPLGKINIIAPMLCNYLASGVEM
jgi:hypothetical protein